MVYDCIIVGGGIGGLSLAIQLADAQRSVLLIEKENYPFNKVCGEYLSNESIHFLHSLGFNINEYNAPIITDLLLSSISGITIRTHLDIGGRGLSRYILDANLATLAGKKGVTVLTGTKVNSVQFSSDIFTVTTQHSAYHAKVVCGSYGRKSNLDVQLKRDYRAGKKDLYIGVKYHIKAGYPHGEVQLHNFRNGYCGMSAVEDGKINISYISKASNLQASGNSIDKMERTILSVNPYLRNYFTHGEILTPREVISHVSFDVRSPIDEHILFVGDAAGSIAPLSGNGMSMAMAASKLAANNILAYLQGMATRTQMEQHYAAQWYAMFRKRTKYAKLTQSVFGRPVINDLSFAMLRLFPFVVDIMSRRIHGERF